MKKDTRVIFVYFLIVLLIWLAGFSPKVKAQEEKILTLGIKFNTWIYSLKNWFSKIFFFKKKETYQDLYYQLLEKIAISKQFSIEEEQYLKKKIKELKSQYSTLNVVNYLSPGIILVEGGENLNLQIGQAVVNEHLVLVGRIAQVQSSFSKVQSLNFPGLEFQVTNLAGQVLGIAQTTGLGIIEVNFVDPNIEIQENDLILTKGGDIFPADLLVARVKEVISLGQFKKILAEPLTDFGEKTLFAI